MEATDAFVVLTERGRDLFFPGCVDEDGHGHPIEVIPCCIDPDRFNEGLMPNREELRREIGADGRKILVYVGALGGLYPASEMAEFVAAARRDDSSTFALVLTQSPPELLIRHLDRLGIQPRDYLIRKVPAPDVPSYLRASDVALSIKRQGYSQAFCSPTKIPEYLACGLPVISSTGIGDTDELLTQERVGVVFRDFTEQDYLQALRAVEVLRQDDRLAERCREVARRRFDLDSSTTRPRRPCKATRPEKICHLLVRCQIKDNAGLMDGMVVSCAFCITGLLILLMVRDSRTDLASQSLFLQSRRPQLRHVGRDLRGRPRLHFEG